MANNFLELLCAIWNVNLFECSFCDHGSFKIKKALKNHLKTFHQVGSNFYVKKKRIGNGNFGEIRVGNNFINKEKVAIKLEPKECENPRLGIEFEFYKPFWEIIKVFRKHTLLNHSMRTIAITMH